MNFYETDSRVRRYCVPERVLKTWGEVQHSEVLTLERPSQVPLAIPDEFTPCKLINTTGEHAAVLVDFGKEFHGSARIFAHDAKSSDRNRVNVRIRFGESVTEAITPLRGKGSTNDHANRDYVWNLGILSANETPATGYRFLYIELLDDNAILSLYMLQGISISRNMKARGSFKCSDERINKIFDTAVYTAHQCCQDYIWDGIKRDRLIWCGDMYPTLLTLLDVYGDQKVIRESLDMQSRITPVGKWMNGMPLYTMWWVMCHALFYRHTGDLEYLTAASDYIAKTMHFAADFIAEDGTEKLPGEFLDWPNSPNPIGVHAGCQAVMKHAYEEAAFIMNTCGRPEDAAFCTEKAELLSKGAFDPHGSKQAAALLGLYGFMTPEEADSSVIAPGGAHGYSTFLGWATLAAKAEAGNMNGALSDMSAYWGGMLDLGATTFWEDFNLDWTEGAHKLDEFVPEGENDIHASHGGYCYEGLRHSFCHAWASGPAPFLINYVLGIKISAPGCSEVEISPDLGNLAWAEGTFPTPYGDIRVRHERTAEGDINTIVSAPKEITIK